MFENSPPSTPLREAERKEQSIYRISEIGGGPLATAERAFKKEWMGRPGERKQSRYCFVSLSVSLFDPSSLVIGKMAACRFLSNFGTKWKNLDSLLRRMCCLEGMALGEGKGYVGHAC
ncbi:hypothetical protein CDAR_495691 [Caerostris darwini]|uniref:Uncharacterized protein n=1 Tax=Caerostris darwini TaxID=1538125 RepID=A0AAV4T0I1_9ARAC|nr:hypothetical protein CDAR_495691 [Caerostris darwini]